MCLSPFGLSGRICKFQSVSMALRKIPLRGVLEMKRLFLIACLVTFGCINIGAQPREAAQTTLIKNATVLTVSRGTLQNTDVLIRNGKITAVGSNLSAPTEIGRAHV